MMIQVFLWALVIGIVFGSAGQLFFPNIPGMIALGPGAFVVSFLFLDKVWRES